MDPQKNSWNSISFFWPKSVEETLTYFFYNFFISDLYNSLARESNLGLVDATEVL